MTHRDEFGQPTIQEEFAEAWTEQARLTKERRARKDADRAHKQDVAPAAAVNLIDRLFQEGNDND